MEGIMKRSTNLDKEHQLTNDLWLLLHDAEQLVVNHENLHHRIHKQLLQCLSAVEAYQNAVLFLIDKQNHPED
jgi:hypothetical protein